MSKSKSKPAAKSVPKSKTATKQNPAAVLADADNNGAGAKLLNLIEEAVTTVAAVNAAETAPAAKKSKPKAVTTVAPVEQNGIRRPAADSLCGRVWKALDDLRAAGVDATAKNAAAAFDGVAIAAATIRTQTQRWKAFNGIKREEKKPVRKSKAATPAVVSEEAQQQAS